MNRGGRLELLPRYRLIEYRGQAFASSSYSENHGAERAFRYQFGSHQPWASASFPARHRVWFRFDHKAVLAKIGFSTVNGAVHNLVKTPEKFDVIGSSDCDSEGTTLSHVALIVEDAGFKGEVDEFKAWIIPEEKRRLYKCWGLRVHSTTGSAPITIVQNMLMWEVRSRE